MGLLEVGQLVTSKMGRDAGKKYVVIGFCDENHVYVADGLIRKIVRPKRKNVKHLVVHGNTLGMRGLDDKEIRGFLQQHSTEENMGEEGLQGHGQG